MRVVAIDVAILPPPAVRDLAIALNRQLPRRGFKGLSLDAGHLPHITVTQQFVAAADLEEMFTRLGAALRDVQPMTLHSPGAVKSRETIWLAIDRAAALLDLHRRLMEALQPFEREGGDPSAFAGGDPRPNDIRWVSHYRASAAFSAYTPHITLGHAASAPAVEPLTFAAADIAACQLGRFCTCRTVLRAWRLSDAAASPS